MEKASLSLSFDDGRADNIEVFEKILFPRNIPVTLNVTTGYIDGSCPKDKMPTDKLPMTVDKIKTYAENPLVELALHGDQHLNTETDIELGRKKMIQWLGLPSDEKFGFASPESKLSVKKFVSATNKLFSDEIAYMRHSLRVMTYKNIRVFARKLGRIIHIPKLYEIAYVDTLMTNCENRVIYAVPVLKDTTPAQLKCIINKSIKKKAALTLMFHSIVKDTSMEDNWSWSIDNLNILCDYIVRKVDQGVIICMTTREQFEELTNYR